MEQDYSKPNGSGGNLCIFDPGQHVALGFLAGISYLKKVPATSDLLKFVLGRQAINLV
jgi:hypothetical protein